MFKEYVSDFYFIQNKRTRGIQKEGTRAMFVVFISSLSVH